MSARPGRDLSDLIKWATRDEWRAHLDGVVAEHFAPAMEEFGLEIEDIDDALGGDWAPTLWACVFEDFLTRRFGSERANPVEAYLRRRGWKESVATRAYMTALQGSAMSLYEVSAIVPGQSLRARDLIRGGAPVLVQERTATRTLKPWDRIAARVVAQGNGSVLAGGVLAFTLDGSQFLFARLRERAATLPRRQSVPGKQKGALKGWTGSDEDLQRAAPLFSIAWLFDVLPRTLHPEVPQLLNSEGDEVVFHTVTFPLASNTTPGDIEERLNRLGDLHQETPTFWNWMAAPPSKRPAIKDQNAALWNLTLEGSVVLGNVELTPRVVALSVNSAARAERGRTMLAAALVGLVAQPLTEIQTIEQVQAAPQSTAHPPPPISAEQQTELIHEVLDRQYRAVPNAPVPMLGNISPRAAARSAHGRKDLVVWLKYLENQSSHARTPDDPMATYDFTWLWRELKVEHLRG